MVALCNMTRASPMASQEILVNLSLVDFNDVVMLLYDEIPSWLDII